MLVNYLRNYRLQWGRPDRLSLLPSLINEADAPHDQALVGQDRGSSSSISEGAPRCFIADTPPESISVITNDWPYSGMLYLPQVAQVADFSPVPPEIEHTLIWTQMPIIPTDLPRSITPRVKQDGLWGFTGSLGTPPSPSLLPQCLPALTDWGVTADKLIRSPKGTDEEETLIKQAGSEIDKFIKRRWVEREWETAWFVNPPVSVAVVCNYTCS